MNTVTYLSRGQYHVCSMQFRWHTMFRSMLSALLVSNVVTIMFYCNKCLLNGLATDSEIHYLKATYPQVFFIVEHV